METPLILERLYRLPPRKKRGRKLGRALRFVRRAALGWVIRRTNWLTCGAVVVSVWLGSHIYYYNELISLEYDVKAAWAQVEVTQQKRNHVQRNLTQLLRYYARYERAVLQEMTAMRTKKSSEPAPETTEQLLARLDAVAEQYPSLNLENTVRQFSETSTQTESEITERIVLYNTAVNTYTTALNRFPANLFGKPMGFEEYDFYAPEDRSKLPYREVSP